MGTRGAFGVIVGEQEKIGYNQLDSYPDGYGIQNLRWLRDVCMFSSRVAKFRALAEQCRVVDEESKPTAADIEKLKGYTNLGVSEQSTDDWYCLTRDTHGSIEMQLRCGYILDWHNFPLDSLFCEWAYIVDFDKEVFEVYEGYQRTLPLAGRWAGRPTPEDDAERYAKHLKFAEEQGREPWDPPVAKWKAVELVASWRFDSLPSDESFLGLFEILAARATLKDADKYPEEVAQVLVRIEDEKLTESGEFAADWRQFRDEALTKISPSDVARVRA